MLATTGHRVECRGADAGADSGGQKDGSREHCGDAVDGAWVGPGDVP